MKPIASSSSENLRLEDTHAGGFHFFPPSNVPSVRGCLLQICPAVAQAEMIRLSAQRSLIGREPSCEITLNDNAVSRTHAAIELDDSGYYVIDLGSRNGTFVDDKILRERRRLHGGELIRLGSTILKFMSSMDEEAQYHAVVQELMTRDPLTNAFNRSYLISTLEKLLPRLQSSKQFLSVIMIDIDYFKKVNDSHGHMVGDEVLRIFSERIRRGLREDDFFCRMGGEEFVVICQRAQLKDAVRIAERIRLTVSSNPFSTQSGVLSITCSLGVATCDPASPGTVDDLLSRADDLMYLAKGTGRNRVCSELDQ
ncbi:MAG TPA: GGDEF domain-containing protein [Planctomycetaceae bacterium]|nr:GGDEF domain-containing protein [Planctomycetaceae bacterium]